MKRGWMLFIVEQWPMWKRTINYVIRWISHFEITSKYGHRDWAMIIWCFNNIINYFCCIIIVVRLVRWRPWFFRPVLSQYRKWLHLFLNDFNISGIISVLPTFKSNVQRSSEHSFINWNAIQGDLAAIFYRVKVVLFRVCMRKCNLNKIYLTYIL